MIKRAILLISFSEICSVIEGTTHGCEFNSNVCSLYCQTLAFAFLSKLFGVDGSERRFLLIFAFSDDNMEL